MREKPSTSAVLKWGKRQLHDAGITYLHSKQSTMTPYPVYSVTVSTLQWVRQLHKAVSPTSILSSQPWPLPCLSTLWNSQYSAVNMLCWCLCLCSVNVVLMSAFWWCLKSSVEICSLLLSMLCSRLCCVDVCSLQWVCFADVYALLLCCVDVYTLQWVYFADVYVYSLFISMLCWCLHSLWVCFADVYVYSALLVSMSMLY